jgi:hypothetical protein
MALTQVQPGMLGTPQPYNFKNRIINGAMTISQRNGTSSVTPANNAYTLDRWVVGAQQGSKFSVQQDAGAVTPPVGFTDYLGVTSLSAYSVLSTDFFEVDQIIEGYNIADFGWGTANAKTVTLSFWVRSSLTGSFGGNILNNGETRCFPFIYTISSANTWEYKTITIPGDTSGTWTTTNNVGLRLCFSLGAGAAYAGPANAWSVNGYHGTIGTVSVVGTNAATWYVTGVQLEVGVSATSFDYRSIGTELQLCQRYFYTKGGNSGFEDAMTGGFTSTTGGNLYNQHPVIMRDAPIMTFSSLANWALYFTGATLTALTTNVSTINGINLIFACTGGTTGYFTILFANNTLNARLNFSAEL